MTISNRLTFHRSEKVWYVCNIFLLISVDNNYVSFVVLALRLPPVVVQGCVRLQTALRSLWCEGCVCVHRLACVGGQLHLILILQCVCDILCGTQQPLEEVFQHHIAEGVKNSSVRQNVDTMPASSQNSQVSLCARFTFSFLLCLLSSSFYHRQICQISSIFTTFSGILVSKVHLACW